MGTILERASVGISEALGIGAKEILNMFPLRIRMQKMTTGAPGRTTLTDFRKLCLYKLIACLNISMMLIWCMVLLGLSIILPLCSGKIYKGGESGMEI